MRRDAQYPLRSLDMTPDRIREYKLLRYCRAPLYTFLILTVALLCSGSAVNFTMDDSLGDGRSQGGASVVYIPSDAWSQGNSCSVCALKPNATLAFDHTWRDTTFTLGTTGPMMMNVSFVGSAVYAYFIVPDEITDPTFTYLVNMTVTLDGEIVDSNVVHQPSGQQDFIYNFLGYMNESLVLGSHVLSIAPNNEPSSSLVLFDYLVYTTDTSELSPSDLSTITVSSGSTAVAATSPAAASVSGSPIATPSSSVVPETTSTPAPSKISAIGPAIGGVAGGLLLVGIAVVLYLRLKRGSRIARQYEIEPHPTTIGYSSTDVNSSERVLSTAYSGEHLTYSDQSLSPTGTSENSLRRTNGNGKLAPGPSRGGRINRPSERELRRIETQGIQPLAPRAEAPPSYNDYFSD